MDNEEDWKKKYIERMRQAKKRNEVYERERQERMEERIRRTEEALEKPGVINFYKKVKTIGDESEESIRIDILDKEEGYGYQCFFEDSFYSEIRRMNLKVSEDGVITSYHYDKEFDGNWCSMPCYKYLGYDSYDSNILYSRDKSKCFLNFGFVDVDDIERFKVDISSMNPDYAMEKFEEYVSGVIEEFPDMKEFYNRRRNELRSLLYDKGLIGIDNAIKEADERLEEESGIKRKFENFESEIEAVEAKVGERTLRRYKNSESVLADDESVNPALIRVRVTDYKVDDEANAKYKDILLKRLLDKVDSLNTCRFANNRKRKELIERITRLTSIRDRSIFKKRFQRLPSVEDINTWRKIKTENKDESSRDGFVRSVRVEPNSHIATNNQGELKSKSEDKSERDEL